MIKKLPAFKKMGKAKAPLWALTILMVASFYFWIGYHLTHAELPSPSSPIQFYATETHHDLQLTYVQAIEGAQHSIHLIIYGLRDHKVIQALKSAAARGVDVRVVCDRNASSGIAKKLGGSIHTTYRKGKGLMHQKILIVDGRLVFGGSANLTTASLKLHGNLVLGFESPALADYLIKKFNNFTNIGLIEPVPHAIFPLNGQELEVWLFPDDPHGVERIKELLRGARKSIKIAMFTWTRYDLADAVIAANNRGVDVEVVMDRNASNGVSKRIAAKLIEGGIPVRINQGPQLLHHKFLLVDQGIVLNGSANWTKAAFVNNDDFFMILSPLNAAQKGTLASMWDAILYDSAPLEQ